MNQNIKLSEKQKQRLQELKERNEAINPIVFAAIDNHAQGLPLNLMLEARFNVLMKKAIENEAEIAYYQEKGGHEGAILIKKRRYDILRGRIQEIKNIGDMLRGYGELGRQVEI